MALLERVTTLIRANLNDLVDKAEDPEVMLRQVIQDMENQLMQVKTQVAISIADQHVLEKKVQEHVDQHAQWVKRAEVAVDRKDDALARSALERSMSCQAMASGFLGQLDDQKAQVESLKTALLKLDQKLAEARAKRDILVAQHRRTRALHRATNAGSAMGEQSGAPAFERMKNMVQHEEAVSQATGEMAGDDVEQRFAAMEKDERIDRLLADLKAKRGS